MAVSTIDNNGANLGQLGNRNLIINGAMQVAQRGTSATTFSYGTVDRFKPSEGSTSSLAITQTQDTNAPSGFSNSLKITVTTAETMSGSKQLAVFHAIEAQNLQQLGYGTSDAQSVTVSFWVKSSVTGAYCLSLYENDDNRNIGATYTINSANTWEYKTITFPPDTVGVIDNNNGGGLETYFFLSVGPDRKTTNNTSWATWSAARFGYGQVADVAGTTNATWQITGVQLEVGDTATPFEHRSYGEELAKCQRYYFQIGGAGQGGGGFDYLAHGFVDSSSRAIHLIQFPQNMRAAPTLVTSQTAGEFYWRAHIGNPTSPTATALPTSGGMSKVCGRVDCNSSGFNTVGAGCFFEQKNSVNTFIAFNAEL